MLIIAGTFRVEAANHDGASQAMREMMAETLKEAGCHAYCFSADLDDPAVTHLFERWESEDHLKAHFSTPHMARFQAAVRNLKTEILELKKYEVSKEGPVR